MAGSVKVNYVKMKRVQRASGTLETFLRIGLTYVKVTNPLSTTEGWPGKPRFSNPEP